MAATQQTVVTPGPAVVTVTTPPQGEVLVSLSPAEVQTLAEKRAQHTSNGTSWLFGLGIFFFIIAIIFVFLLPRCWRWIAYTILALGFIFMLVAAFLYCLYAPDRYCSRNPDDTMCAQRYHRSG